VFVCDVDSVGVVCVVRFIVLVVRVCVLIGVVWLVFE